MEIYILLHYGNDTFSTRILLCKKKKKKIAENGNI